MSGYECEYVYKCGKWLIPQAGRCKCESECCSICNRANRTLTFLHNILGRKPENRIGIMFMLHASYAFACHIRMPHSHAAFACCICMPHSHAAFACRIRIPHSHAAFAYRIRMPHSHASYTCRTHIRIRGQRIWSLRLKLVSLWIGFDWGGSLMP